MPSAPKFAPQSCKLRAWPQLTNAPRSRRYRPQHRCGAAQGRGDKPPDHFTTTWHPCMAVIAEVFFGRRAGWATSARRGSGSGGAANLKGRLWEIRRHLQGHAPSLVHERGHDITVLISSRYRIPPLVRPKIARCMVHFCQLHLSPVTRAS